ncbi:aldehyde dehydrogenase family protein [Saccharothrix australiensis]|uniref:Aldehyde dehydrogenase n=1 Tax=Saccharothrix australiensis TaxID=2072 RepID=A0A495VZF4_9PSEU|nr:aldehyde dehydrogenase family protein [Saccharothrix australiensis]RKT52988.1 aldehyde dehydrogenase [Saccharothrix australiensis]
MAKYAAPGRPGSVVSYRERYDHFIGGEHVPPARGAYFADPSPVTGEVFTEVARGTAEDVERALDAAHGAARAWGRTSAAERANVLNEIADRVEDHLEALAVAETWENGKPVRESLAVDLPQAVDRFRCFAGAIRAQEGGISQVGEDLVAYHFPEPLGVVGRLLPWNFPLLTAASELAPALAAGNAVVLKPAEQTPASVHVLMGLIGDLLPPGVVNVVNGFGEEAGRSLASSRRVAMVSCAGGASAGWPVAEDPAAVAPEPGGRSPNIFFADVAARRDAFYDKALEGFTGFARNQGEAGTCPSRALIQASVYDRFLADATERTEAIRQGDPLDTDTMIGAQVSVDRLTRVLSYIDIGEREGARLVCGGGRADLGGALSGGYYVTPTIFEGDHRMRVFREEILGPVVSVTRFDDFADALKIANDTPCGPGAGVWSRDGATAYRAGREIRAARVWVNDYHPYPAGAAFGGCLLSGTGHEDRRALLDHYQRTKSLLVSYSAGGQGRRLP